MYLSWIIPCYNEERRIEKTIREVEQYLRSKNFPGGHEILVVDSFSPDRTAEIVKKLQLEFPALKLLIVKKRGKGYGVKVGMLQTSGDIRLFSDADNSTAPEYFDAMRPLFQSGSEVVISSRDPKDAPGASRDVEEVWYREIMGRIGNLVIQIFGVWGIWDTQNGFKALTAKAAEDIFSRSLMGGFSFDIEMLALARKLGYRISIIPVKWKWDPDSTVTLKAYILVFVDVFRIRLNLLLRRYRLQEKLKPQ